jgi:hypothetical protein
MMKRALFARCSSPTIPGKGARWRKRGNLAKSPEITVLIDRETVFLFAETAHASDALRSFCFDMNWEYEIGHGSKELGTYKDFTFVILEVTL